MSPRPRTISIDVVKRANPSGGRPQFFVVEQSEMALSGERSRPMPYEWGPFSERGAHRQLRRVQIRRQAEATPDEVVTRSFPELTAPEPQLPDPFEPRPDPARPLAAFGRVLAPDLGRAKWPLVIVAGTGLLAGVVSLLFALPYLLALVALVGGAVALFVLAALAGL